MEDVVFIDTNIWCYYFNQSSIEHLKVVEYLDKIFENYAIYVNTVVLMEVAHYLIKNLGAVIGKQKIELLINSDLKIIDFDFDLMIDSITELAKYTHTGISGRDASILASMSTIPEITLITHDNSFKNIDDLKIIDPVLI